MQTELILSRANTIKHNLATYNQFDKANQELNRLRGNQGSLTLQLLFSSMDDYQRDQAINKAITTTEEETQRALLIMESELGL